MRVLCVICGEVFDADPRQIAKASQIYEALRGALGLDVLAPEAMMRRFNQHEDCTEKWILGDGAGPMPLDRAEAIAAENDL